MDPFAGGHGQAEAVAQRDLSGISGCGASVVGGPIVAVDAARGRGVGCAARM